MRKTILTTWVAVVLAGCTVGGTDSNGAGGGGGGADAAAGTGGSAPEPDAQVDGNESQVPAIEGAWAQILVYGAINDIPAVGQTNGSTTTIQRIEIQRSGEALSMTAEPCVIEIDNGAGGVINTIVPDAFLASLGITDRAGSLEFVAGQWRFVQDRKLQLRGVHLTEPETEVLPSDAADPRVWDQDEDGHPGVTVRISGLTDGEVYLIQRDVHSLDGVASGDHIDGLVDWSTEQVVLGSDNDILNMQTQSTKDPDASASWFRSTRIDGSVGCDGILADRDALFAR